MDEAPKGTRLDFETSGRLKTTSVVASQKGTTVTVENLFTNLPVRRRGLEKNIKREYAKVLGLLQAYACVSTAVKFSVSNLMAKGKRVIVFATKSNTTTRENVANVFGAKTLPALIQMDLSFSMLNTRSTIAQADEGWVKPHSIWNRGARKLTGSGINKSVSLGMFPDPFLAKEDRLLIDRCSSSIHDHVRYPSLPRCSMRFTNPIMFLNHLLYLRTLSLIQVRRAQNPHLFVLLT